MTETMIQTLMTDTFPAETVLFDGDVLVARGARDAVSIEARERAGSGAHAVQMFDLSTGRVIDPQPAGIPEAAISAPTAARTRGRPKLGVVAREVTLLPRHWDWLAAQPGGASAAVRRLVDAARREGTGAVDRRAAQEAAYRFMTTMAGDRAGYEDAVRALYAGDAARFDVLISAWPEGVRRIAGDLARSTFDAGV